MILGPFIHLLWYACDKIKRQLHLCTRFEKFHRNVPVETLLQKEVKHIIKAQSDFSLEKCFQGHQFLFKFFAID